MIRRVLYSALIVAFVWVILSRSSEITNLGTTLAQGNWDWVIIAAVLQVVYLIAFTASYKTGFGTVGIKTRFRDMFPLMLGSLFVNAVAPAGGAAGVALFVDDVSRRGNSGARAIAGTIVQMIADFSALTLILIVSMTYLFIWDTLPSYVVWGSIVLLLITGAMSSILIIGMVSPSLLNRVFEWMQGASKRLLDPFMREPLLPEGWATKSAEEFVGASLAIKQYPRRLFNTFGLMLATHLLAIGGLHMLFLAFDEPIYIGTLVTGYAVGILTWIVSPAPQGTGVVEGAMVLVMTSLEVPWNVAVTVTLAFRGMTFWLPVILGFFMLRRIKTFEPTPGPEWEEGSVQVVALLIGWLGLVNVLMSVAPSAHDQLVILGRVSPFFVPYEYQITEVLTGVALIVAANGLWRRKRMIWILLIISIIVLAVGYLLLWQRPDLTVLSLGLALWLFALRSKFTISSDGPSIRRGLRVLIAGLVVALVIGVGGFYLLGQRYDQAYSVRASINQTLVMFTQFYDPGLQPLIGVGTILGGAIYVFGAISFGFMLAMAMRPVQIWKPASWEERTRARKIVEAYGCTSLAYLTLFEDKAYYFSTGGSLIAYTVQGRVALTLGDPIGPNEDFLATVTGFRVFCFQNDWIPAFCMTLPNHAKEFRQLDFDNMCLGNEAVIDLNEFKLEGNANKNFRKRFNRLGREGFKVVIHDPPLPAGLIDKLRAVSDEWLTMTRGSEKRFFLGSFDTEYISSGSVAVVYTPDGEVTAFTNIVPEFQKKEITIDLMRRKTETESGTMDFLFVYLYLWAKENGFDTFNMGLCALSSLCEGDSLPIVHRALQWFYEHGSWIYHFKGIYEFKDKFHPDWTPQYLTYPSMLHLPEIWMAMVLANAGEEDFPWKYFMRKSSVERPEYVLSAPLDAPA
jgi:phosphatidylglycerol lysyltransferase